MSSLNEVVFIDTAIIAGVNRAGLDPYPFTGFIRTPVTTALMFTTKSFTPLPWFVGIGSDLWETQIDG